MEKIVIPLVTFKKNIQIITQAMIDDFEHEDVEVTHEGSSELFLSRTMRVSAPIVGDIGDVDIDTASPAEKTFVKIHENIPLLKGFNDREALFLIRDISFVHYNMYEEIFKQGSEGDAFYYILQGSVEISVGGARDKLGQKHIANLEKSRTFGEIAPISHSKRNARAMCTCDSVLLRIEIDFSKQQLQPKLYNKLYENIILMLSEKIDRINKNHLV